MIDAIKTSNAYKFDTWSKAEIMAILPSGSEAPNMGNDERQPKKLRIKYYGDTSVAEKTMDFEDKLIAPFDTMTTGDEWRNTLKIGDMIDVWNDKENKWINSTVIEVKQN